MKMADLLNTKYIQYAISVQYGEWNGSSQCSKFQHKLQPPSSGWKRQKKGCSTILRCTVRATHQTIHFHSPQRPLLYCMLWCWNIFNKPQQPKLQTWMESNTALRSSSNQYIGCCVTMYMWYNLHHYAWPVDSVSEGQGSHWSHKFVYESLYLHH